MVRLNLGRKTIYCCNVDVISNEDPIVIQESALQLEDDDPEGRLDAFMDAEDNIDEIGYSPVDEQAVPTPKPEIEIAADLRHLFEEEIAPLIVERSSSEPYMVIEVSSDQPVRKTIFRRTKADIDELEEHVQGLIEKGIVEPSTSPHDSPIFLVKKKNGKKRPILDYREINKIILFLSFPIPLIGYILDLLAGYAFYSVLDLSNGFFQCPLHPDSRKYTAFSTSRVCY